MLLSSAAPSHSYVPGSAANRLGAAFAGLLEAVRVALARRRTRIALEELDEHRLHDVGLSRFRPSPDPFAFTMDCSSWR